MHGRGTPEASFTGWMRPAKSGTGATPVSTRATPTPLPLAPECAADSAPTTFRKTEGGPPSGVAPAVAPGTRTGRSGATARTPGVAATRGAAAADTRTAIASTIGRLRTTEPPICSTRRSTDVPADGTTETISGVV